MDKEITDSRAGLSGGSINLIEFIEIYSESVPENKVEYEDIVFYGIVRMYDENIAYVPGINIFPLGLFGSVK